MEIINVETAEPERLLVEFRVYRRALERQEKDFKTLRDGIVSRFFGKNTLSAFVSDAEIYEMLLSPPSDKP
jgi:hypothetical protein